MKYLLLFFCISLNLYSQIPNFVKEFHVVSGKKAENNFIKKYKNSNNVNASAYVISFEMKQAEYAFFPWKKLAIFNRGKKILTRKIEQHPNNPHFRYVRLLIQEKTPKILGYDKQIENDKKVLQSFLNKADETDYLDTFILKNTSL